MFSFLVCCFIGSDPRVCLARGISGIGELVVRNLPTEKVKGIIRARAVFIKKI